MLGTRDTGAISPQVGRPDPDRRTPVSPGSTKGSSMKRPGKLLPLGAALVVLTLGAAPILSSAADHIDASAFGSLGTPGGAFNPVSQHGERDINDVYAFQGSDASRTVLAMTTNPAINAFGGKFGVQRPIHHQRRSERGRRPGSGLRRPVRQRLGRPPEVHRHPLHGCQRRFPQDRQRPRLRLHRRHGQGLAQGRWQGLRGRPLGPVLLRSDGLRRHALQHRQ